MIDASEVQHPHDYENDSDDAGESGGGSIVGKVLIGAIALGSFGIWAYAYSGLATPDREYTDQLDAATFAAAAEPICFAAKEDMSTLPYSIDAADANERADQINDADAILQDMVDDLRTIDLAGESDRDAGMVSQWLDEYDIYVDDRERYADTLRVDREAVITFTDLGTGLIERRLTWFADVNQMDSCMTPKDVG